MSPPSMRERSSSATSPSTFDPQHSRTSMAQLWDAPVVAPAPMGMFARLGALEDAQRRLADKHNEQAEEIAALKHESAAKDKTIEDLEGKVTHLEHLHAERVVRRNRSVAKLREISFHHQDASNAYRQLISVLQADDLEGHMLAYADTVAKLLNSHEGSIQSAYHSHQLHHPHTGPMSHVNYGQHGMLPHRYGGNQYPAPQMPPAETVRCGPHKNPFPCPTCLSFLDKPAQQ